MRRPERHPRPDAQLQCRPARVQYRTVRPRPATQNDRPRLEWLGGPAASQSEEKVGPVEMEKAHRWKPVWRWNGEAATAEPPMRARSARSRRVAAPRAG